FSTGGYQVSPPMTKQYEWFTKNMLTGQKYSNWDGESSLFIVWFGINDINGKSRITKKTSSEVDELITTSMFNMVNDMYDNGAKNFMFIYVPPMEKFPAYINNRNTNIKTEVINFNENLNKFAKNFQATHLDTNVLVYNSYDEFNYIMENKNEYNIEDITYECKVNNYQICETYFWMDDFHPTQTIHKYLAEDINEFLNT
ncbi:hypothetical protein BCR32DRAFT_196619, partial [Anaeromyces robustus]